MTSGEEIRRCASEEEGRQERKSHARPSERERECSREHGSKRGSRCEQRVREVVAVCAASLSLSPHETPPQLLSPSSPPQSPSSVCCVRSPQLESHACQMMHSRPLRHSSAGISRGGSASDAADVARSSRRRPRALVLAVAVRAAAGLACFPDQLLLLPSSSFSRKSRLRARHPCRQLCS